MIAVGGHAFLFGVLTSYAVDTIWGLKSVMRTQRAVKLFSCKAACARHVFHVWKCDIPERREGLELEMACCWCQQPAALLFRGWALGAELWRLA